MGCPRQHHLLLHSFALPAPTAAQPWCSSACQAQDRREQRWIKFVLLLPFYCSTHLAIRATDMISHGYCRRCTDLKMASKGNWAGREECDRNETGERSQHTQYYLTPLLSDTTCPTHTDTPQHQGRNRGKNKEKNMSSITSCLVVYKPITSQSLNGLD